MPDDFQREVAVSPIAGVGIVHHCANGIMLVPPHGSQWPNGSGGTAPIRIRHLVGPTAVAASDLVFAVSPDVSYYSAGTAGVAVSMTRLVPGVEQMLLVPNDGGREYEMRYSSLPPSAVPRTISEIPAFALSLAARGIGVLAHGCGFIMPSGRAALCLGVSGAGKSTLARMMHLVPGVRVVNDDRLVIADFGGGIRLWSTPWPGQAGVATPGDAPLAAIALIGRSETASVAPLSGRATTTALLQTLAVPVWNPLHAARALEQIAMIANTVPIVRLEYPLADTTPQWILDTLESLVQA